MSVMKEWECPQHGCFESTHPICPDITCSADCRQVFLTPPTVSDGTLKRFDAGVRRSAELMGITNFRTARAGEAAYGNSGKGMLWGNDIQKALGVDMGTLAAAASVPLTVTHKDGHQEKIEKSPMRELARDSGLTKRVLPIPADRTGHRGERKQDPFK